MVQGFVPYVGFYSANNISPVRQDISDLRVHYQRRENLYRSLGIPSIALKGASVLEFGPGSGFNSLYTQFLRPENYVLVDANPKAIEDCHELLGKYFPNADNYSIVQSTAENYTSDQKFDFVLCEGMLAHQLNSKEFIRMIGEFVEPGGVLVTTSADYTGHFAETLRRLIRSRILNPNEGVQTQIEFLTPVFKSHYETIKGRSRPFEDWLLDNIIMPYPVGLFGSVETIKALDEDFHILGAAPNCLTEERWYKGMPVENADFNEKACRQIEAVSLSFLDGRIPFQTIGREDLERLQKACERTWFHMIGIEINQEDHWGEVIEDCKIVADVVSTVSTQTAAGLQEVVAFFEHPEKHDPTSCFPNFAPVFGHAQHYLSFMRKIDLGNT